MRRLNGLFARVPAGLRASLLYALAMMWAKALAMVTVPLLTARLNPAEFGRLELLSSAAEIGGLIAGAGLVDTLYRFASVGGEAGRRAGAQVAGLSLMVAVGGIAATLLLSNMLAAHMPLATPGIDIVLLGIAVALESVIGVPLGWLRMHRRAGTFAALVSLRATLQAALVAGLVLTGHGVEGVLWAACVTCLVVASVLSVRQLRDTGIVIAPRASLRLLGYGVPLIGSGLASFVLGTADRWLLAGNVSASSLGHYALAAKVSMILMLFAQPFELWWYPQRLSFVTTPEGRAHSSRVVGGVAAGLIWAGAGVALASPWLVALLAPPSYAPAAAMAPFLVVTLILQFVSSMANAGCYARRTGSQAMAVNAAAAVLALALYLLLIPRFGVAGAIAATLGAQAGRLWLFATLSQRTVRLTWPLGRLAAVSVAGMATGGAPLLLGTGAAGALVGAGLLAVTAVLALLTLDRAILRALLARLPRRSRAEPVQA